MEQFLPSPSLPLAAPLETQGKQHINEWIEVKPEVNFKIDKKWHVEIPWYKSSMQGKETFIVFTLRVFYGDLKWTIEKRFSECHSFSEELFKKYEGVPEFPARQPKFLHDPKFLQNRQRELEIYFQKFDQAAYATEEMRNFLNAYTELDKIGVTLPIENRRLQEMVPNTIFCVNSTVMMPSGFSIPARMTVIKLRNGDILLYSPTRFDDALHYELLHLGTVKYILAPNKMHNLFVAEYLLKFPEAILYLAPGLKERNPEFERAHVLGANAESAWAAEIDQSLTGGNSFFSEVVLFHKTSRVLIVADLLINFAPGYFESQSREGEINHSALATLYFSEPIDKPMCSPEHTSYCTDANLFEKHVDRLLALDLSAIIMSHGDIIFNPDLAKSSLKSAIDRVLAQVRSRWGITNSVYSLVGDFWSK